MKTLFIFILLLLFVGCEDDSAISNDNNKYIQHSVVYSVDWVHINGVATYTNENGVDIQELFSRSFQKPVYFYTKSARIHFKVVSYAHDTLFIEVDGKRLYNKMNPLANEIYFDLQ